MDAAGRHSASPEDRSDGNESLSAPSEFLAEFLSAIMRRQYAEALKYCRLILQYEPHNATASGFYPLLQHKLLSHAPANGEQHSSSSETSGAGGARGAAGLMVAAADGSDDEGSGGSVASQSSLELDSEPSLELSRRTDSASAASASAGRWESSGRSGSASRSDADADDNGNAPPPPLCSNDGDENDNDNVGSASCEPHAPRRARGLASRATQPKDESAAALQRLRAQFACSIK